jgi:hypothetical protein
LFATNVQNILLKKQKGKKFIFAKIKFIKIGIAQYTNLKELRSFKLVWALRG